MSQAIVIIIFGRLGALIVKRRINLDENETKYGKKIVENIGIWSLVWACCGYNLGLEKKRRLALYVLECLNMLHVA